MSKKGGKGRRKASRVSKHLSPLDRYSLKVRVNLATRKLMAAKSQQRLSGKGSKSGGSSSSLSAKGDGKGGRKRVTMEDEEGEEKDAMAFKILSTTDTNNLMSCNVLQIESGLKERFSLTDYQIDLTQAAILDFYTSAIYWGIQQKFTAQQLSGFFTVVHTLLENVKEKQLNMVDNLNEMKKMLIGIGVDDVKSKGLDFFTVEQAKLITDYINTSFFQHYKLYLYMFSHSQAEEIIGTDLTVEVAKSSDVPFPPPLDEGVTEGMFNDYIATPPPTPTPEQSDQESSPKKSHLSRAKTPKSRDSSSKSKRGGSRSKSRGSSKGSARGATKGKKVKVEEKPDPATELEEQVSQSDLFSHLTAEDVREVVESVAKDMLGNLQNEIGVKLKEKENQIIQRINKIHKVAE